MLDRESLQAEKGTEEKLCEFTKLLNTFELALKPQTDSCLF